MTFIISYLICEISFAKVNLSLMTTRELKADPLDRLMSSCLISFFLFLCVCGFVCGGQMCSSCAMPWCEGGTLWNFLVLTHERNSVSLCQCSKKKRMVIQQSSLQICDKRKIMTHWSTLQLNACFLNKYNNIITFVLNSLLNKHL